MTDDMVKRIARKVVAGLEGQIESMLRAELGSVLGFKEAPAPPSDRGGGPARAPDDVERWDRAKRPIELAPRTPGVKRGSRVHAVSLNEIKALLAKEPAGLRSEVIRARLGLSGKVRRAMSKILRDAVAAKVLTRKGEKRATTYSLRKRLAPRLNL